MNNPHNEFSGNVLVVDDDFAVRTIACETLVQAGFVVKAVDNGRDALDLFEMFRPDTILLDLLMPDMDGFQTCREIRSMPGGADVPILISTGLDDLESITSAYQYGATDFVTKPLQWLALPYRIKFLIESARANNEHKKAAELLKQSEEKFRTLFEQFQDAVFITIPDGKILKANPAACTIFGMTEQEMCEFGRECVMDTEDPRLSYALEERKRTGKIITELTCKRKNGERFPAEVRSVISATETLQSFVIVRDISERINAEFKLRESEEKFRTIFDQAIDGIMIADAETGINIEANSAMCTLLGYAPEELIGLGIEKIHPQNDMPAIRDVFAKQLRGEFSLAQDLPMLRKDGTVFYADVNATRITLGGKQCLVGIFRDITDRKKAEMEKIEHEQQLQQTQKLESLGVLAGGIAHDFNNLLAVIIGHCSLALINPKSADTHIPPIETAANRAAELCRQMLAYAGKTLYIKSAVNVGELINEMVKMLKSTIVQNVVITSDIAADLPPITADASQIRQVIMNLVINASEAIGKAQGAVNVSLTKIAIEEAQNERDYFGKIIKDGCYLCIEVADNGCGMDEETKLHIFEPFYTTKFTGRGLGMSAVHGIIAGHNGALQIFSEPGQGTTFKIYLRLPDKSCTENQSQSEETESMSWRGSGAVLLVEDEEHVIAVVRDMLEELGFTVVEAHNGREALELYQRNAEDISLVVTDMDMPVMDGATLFHELKTLKPELPIIISSGFGDADITSRIAREKIAGYIGKPYNFKEIREVMKNVVEEQA